MPENSNLNHIGYAQKQRHYREYLKIYASMIEKAADSPNYVEMLVKGEDLPHFVHALRSTVEQSFEDM